MKRFLGITKERKGSKIPTCSESAKDKRAKLYFFEIEKKTSAFQKSEDVADLKFCSVNH